MKKVMILRQTYLQDVLLQFNMETYLIHENQQIFH